MTRKERREQNPEIQKRRAEFSGGGGILSQLPLTAPGNNGGDSGGWGQGNPTSKPAGGQAPGVNPFIMPKSAGLNIISQSFPSNYYVEWNLSTWRAACDQAIKMGNTMSYATLVSWAYECSPFVQSLFTKLGAALDRVNFFVVDQKGNRLDDLTTELCNKPWQIQLRREILYSFFWGFSGLNFDPYMGKLYKYPMQQIDPINRMLRASTYSYYDGTAFADNANLLFVQPSSNYESFLGWMQPITRSFVQMNLTKNNWVSAGRRLAFPLMTVGYPQNDGGMDSQGNANNPYRIQAENIAGNVDPSKGLVYPYTMGPDGTIQKAIEVDFENPGAGANIHKIYSEFNQAEKDEIREMIFGGSLTGNVGTSGSRALGEVQERMLDSVIQGKIEYILSILNFDFAPKISKFYDNLPDGWKFEVNRAKQLTMEEITELSAIVVENGKRFTDDFFEANGISREFIEDAPAVKPIKPAGMQGDETVVNMADPGRTRFGLKKKYL